MPRTSHALSLPSKNAVVVTSETQLSGVAHALTIKPMQPGATLRAKLVYAPGHSKSVLVLYVPEKKTFSLKRWLTELGFKPFQRSEQKKQENADRLLRFLFGRELPLVLPLDVKKGLFAREPRVTLLDLRALAACGQVFKQLAEANISLDAYAGGADGAARLLAQMVQQVQARDPEGSAQSAITKNLVYTAHKNGCLPALVHQSFQRRPQGPSGAPETDPRTPLQFAIADEALPLLQWPDPLIEALLDDDARGLLEQLKANAGKYRPAQGARVNAQFLARYLQEHDLPLHQRCSPQYLAKLKMVQANGEQRPLPPHLQEQMAQQGLTEPQMRARLFQQQLVDTTTRAIDTLASQGPAHAVLVAALRSATEVDPISGACTLQGHFKQLAQQVDAFALPDPLAPTNEVHEPMRFPDESAELAQAHGNQEPVPGRLGPPNADARLPSQALRIDLARAQAMGHGNFYSPAAKTMGEELLQAYRGRRADAVPLLGTLAHLAATYSDLRGFTSAPLHWDQSVSEVENLQRIFAFTPLLLDMDETEREDVLSALDKAAGFPPEG